MAQTIIQVNADELRTIIHEIVREVLPMQKRTEKEEFLTRREACQLLKITDITLARYIKKGLYRTTPDGRRLPKSQFSEV